MLPAMIFTRSAEELVALLRVKGIKDERVLSAVRAVPRDQFVTEGMRSEAWEDCALPIGEGQTISQPYVVALMTAEVRLDARSRMLEVGTGSGSCRSWGWGGIICMRHGGESRASRA